MNVTYRETIIAVSLEKREASKYGGLSPLFVLNHVTTDIKLLSTNNALVPAQSNTYTLPHTHTHTLFFCDFKVNNNCGGKKQISAKLQGPNVDQDE